METRYRREHHKTLYGAQRKCAFENGINKDPNIRFTIVRMFDGKPDTEQCSNAKWSHYYTWRVQKVTTMVAPSEGQS